MLGNTQVSLPVNTSSLPAPFMKASAFIPVSLLVNTSTRPAPGLEPEHREVRDSLTGWTRYITWLRVQTFVGTDSAYKSAVTLADTSNQKQLGVPY